MGTHSIYRLAISSTSYDSCPIHHDGWLDEESHAEMHCAGATFTVLAFSNYTCNIDPFLGSYQTTTCVPIVKATTAVQ
eukprot:14705322-Ditylum_brightwellii.AAC.1